MEPHFYSIDLAWTADRKGNLSSSELNDKLDVATPLPFAKGIEGVWSPEHLFTAAIISCYMTTFLAIAENSKLEFDSFTCSAKGKLEQIEGKYLMTEVTLEPVLKIKKQEDESKAERILQKSEAACLISNSIKATVHLNSKINW